MNRLGELTTRFDSAEPEERVHPRTIGWVGTVALAMGGSNQSLFLIAALFGGQGDIPGQGSASIVLLIAGLLLSYAAAPGWIELVLMSPNRVGGIAAACTSAFKPYSLILSTLAGVCYWWGWVPTCGLTALFSASAINQWALPGVPVPAIACFLVILFVGVNLAGIKWVAQLSILIASVSAGLAFVSMIAPVAAGNADWSKLGQLHLTLPFEGWFGAVTSLMAGLYLIGFAAPAFEAATCHVAETIDQNRNVPRAVFVAAFMAAVFFVGLPVVWFCTLGAEPLSGDLGQVLGPTFAPVAGSLAKTAAIWFMMFNMFHGTIQPLAGAARTLSQLSEDGLLPRALAWRSRQDVPWVATVATAAFSILFLLVGDPIWLVAAANFTYLIGICLPNIAVWLLRHDAPDQERPWRAPRGTIGLGVAAAIVWMLSAILGFEQFGLPTVVFGLAMAYSGAALFAWRMVEDRVRAGLPAFVPTLHINLTGAMLLVLSLDAAGYLLAIDRITPGSAPALIAALEDIFVAVAILTITVGIVLPGMIAHSATEISVAARGLASGVLTGLSRAMDSLARGDLEGANLQTMLIPLKVRSGDELGAMAESFNAMQQEAQKVAIGLDGAREGLKASRLALTEANEHLREEILKQESLTVELIAARDAAEAGNRSKAGFLAMISHELRTPLNGVIGMAGLLLDDNLDARSRRHAETLNEAADQLLALINDLLDFTKLEANRLSFEEIVFDLDAVVRSVIDLMKSRSQAKGLHLAKYISAEIPPVLVGDPGRLRQVLMNLMSNAVKFTDRGMVSVEVNCKDIRDGEVTLEFSVKDTGIGITSEKLPILFQEFSQVDSSISRRFGGTGLGLSICKRLVAGMGGTIGVESEPGLGSKFQFTARFKLPDTASVSLEDSPPVLDGERILLVDEDEADRMALESELSSHGAAVTPIENPSEALPALRKAAVEKAAFRAVLFSSSSHGREASWLGLAIRTAADIPTPRLVLAVPRELDADERASTETQFDAVLVGPRSSSALIRALSLPPTNGPMTNSVPSETLGPPAGPRLNKLRVLVAEDNPTNQQVIKEMLDKAGVRTDVVGNGLEAVLAMQERPYDLILMDVMMPEFDGLYATREIRALTGEAANVPIFGLTANASLDDHAGFIAAGMDQVLSKPLRYRQLVEIVAQPDRIAAYRSQRRDKL